MRIQTLRYLVAGLPFILSSPGAQAQAPNYNPFFIVNPYENIYRADQGLLTLPSISVLPTVNSPQQQLFNVELKHRGGNNFELVAVDELLPEQECTRAEVSQAIPQLTLGMTVDEAEALIGCTANLQLGRVDIDTGREVFATWLGRDGVPNITNAPFGSSSISGGSSVWIGGSSNSVFAAPLSSGGSPSITFLLRENVLQSISYSDTDQYRFCYNADLLAGFRQINLEDDYATVVSSLECEGNLQRQAFDASSTQQEYSWQVPPGPQTGIPTVVGIVPGAISESIRVTLLDGRVQSLRYDSTRQYASAAPCSIENLEAAASQLQAGQNASQLGALLDCGVRTETLSSDGLIEASSYRWQTSIPNESLFVSSNRMLQVFVRDGVVGSVRLDRF